MLTRRRLPLLFTLPLLLGACSTALLVDTPFDDDPQPDASTLVDAGVPQDAASPRDSGTSADSGAARDAGIRIDGGATRDSGTSADSGASRDASVSPDVGFPRDCKRDLPSAGIASLLTDDCSMRPTLMCPNQTDLDRQFARLAAACRVPAKVTVGFVINASGCPELLTYDQRTVQGSPSLCLQTVLETVRLTCPNRCGLLRTP